MNNSIEKVTEDGDLRHALEAICDKAEERLLNKDGMHWPDSRDDIRAANTAAHLGDAAIALAGLQLTDDAVMQRWPALYGVKDRMRETEVSDPQSAADAICRGAEIWSGQKDEDEKAGWFTSDEDIEFRIVHQRNARIVLAYLALSDEAARARWPDLHRSTVTASPLRGFSIPKARKGPRRK